MKLKVPRATSYTTLTAPVLDISSSSSDGRYQAFVDVTTRVAAAGSGDYWVGDVQEATGQDRYGGWALVVAYRDTTQPARNLTIFDGLQSVTSGSPPVEISLAGFRTPSAGPVRTTLGFVAYEGDLGTKGDSLTLNTTTLSDASNPADNFFNSSITSGGTTVTAKDPNFKNQLGFDVNQVIANGILPNGATSAKIALKTNQDQYFPGVVTFATELFAPSVQTTKTAADLNGPPAKPGDTLRYTVTFTNSGQDGAANFVAEDVIPSGTTYVPGSLRIVTGPGAPANPTDAVGDDLAEFSAGQNSVTFRLGQGATRSTGGLLTASGGAASTTSISFDVKLNADLPARSRIVNQAQGSFGAQSLGTPLSSVSPEVATTVDAPDPTIAKSHTGSFVGGAPTPFTITVSNAGTIPTDGSPVTVTDAFPSGTAGFDSITVASAVGWTCAVTPPTTLTCTRTDALAASASYPPIVVNAVVHNPVPASIINTAVVAGGGDNDPSNNQATDVGPGTVAADLGVTKTASDSAVPSGGQVTFTITVKNAGPSTAEGVTLTDTLGADYAAVSVTPSQGTCTTAVVCTIGSMAPNTSVTVTISATVTANNTTLMNTASVSATTPDPVSADNTDSATIIVQPTTDLQLTKSVNPNPTAGVQDDVTYTITVVNNGPLGATNVGVDDTLPLEFTPSSVSAPGFTCSLPGGRALSCRRASLSPADGPVTITIVGTFSDLAAGTFVRNGAAVSADEADPNPGNNQDTAVTVPIPAADLSLTKTASAPFVGPGQTATFTLSLLNIGPSPANNVTIADTLPDRLEFDSASTGCVPAGATVTCTLGSVPPGATRTVTVIVRVASGAIAGQTLTNTASASSDTPDPIPSNNSAAEPLTVTNPNAVTVTRFTALRTPRGVRLTWRTAQETSMVGFNVYRIVGRTLERLNPTLLPHRGRETAGATYSFLDAKAPVTRPALYRLQAISLDGKASWQGVAQATARRKTHA